MMIVCLSESVCYCRKSAVSHQPLLKHMRQELKQQISRNMSNTPVSPRSMRAEDVLKEIQSNLLECKVCFESFSVLKREHTARNLPCGHVLCLKCVCTLSHPVRQTLDCPFCREPCETSSTSECRVLADLQELLGSSGHPGPPAFHHDIHRAEGLGSRALCLHAAFGGWGTTINPSGIAVVDSSGQIIVVHDGEERVALFTQQGTRVHSFGRYGRGPADVCHPLDVAVTSGGHVVVTDAGDGSVKVFRSTGCPVMTIRDSFRLPWGVDVDAHGWILVTDAQMGTLSQLKLNFDRGAVLVNRVVQKDLTCPRSVACCRISGNVAVVEHLGCFQSSFTLSRLKVFDNDFVLLSQVDSFALNLMDSVSISVSSVCFDRCGDVIVGDMQRGMVWGLGKPQITRVLTPLVSGLMRPAGLIVTDENVLVVLDSGDHTVKLYRQYTEDLYCEKT